MKEEDRVKYEQELRDKILKEMAEKAPKKKGFFSRFKREKKDAAAT
jgi:hypothetical protein